MHTRDKDVYKIVPVPPSTAPIRACLHGGGGPQIGEVTFGGSPHLSCKRDHIKMRHYMDRRVTQPKPVTSPTWGPLPPCKQALSVGFAFLLCFRVLQISAVIHFLSCRT